MQSEGLQYFDLLHQEENRNIQFYFDAFDVVEMLQGVNKFYPDGDQKRREKFSRDKFDEESSTIQTLAFGGFLGKNIMLLPTHQAELARLIKQNSDIFYSKDNNILQKFLEEDMHLRGTLTAMIADNSNNLQRPGMLVEAEENNQDLFKAIFISYKARYKDRLEEVFGNAIIKISDYTLDDIQLDDFLFNTLSDAFKVHRPRKEAGGNNFSDVAALMYLATQVKLYNKDNTNPLPVYFDSRNYRNFIPRHILEQYFLIETKSNSAVSIPSYALRDHDFFKFFALTRYNKAEAPDEDRLYRRFSEYSDTGKILERSFVENTITASQPLPDVSKWYTEKNMDLNYNMLTHAHVNFHKSVINEVKNNRLYIINEILEALRLDKLNPDTINSRNEIILEHLSGKINELLTETVSMYNTIQNRIREVMTTAERLQEEGYTLDVFEHYSLFRFLIPKNPHQKNLRQFFSEDGLLASNNQPSNFSRMTLWNFYYRTVYYSSNTNKVSRDDLLEISDLYTLYGSFWILNLHDKIIRFNSKKEYLEPLDHSLLMLIGACIHRSINEAVMVGDSEDEEQDEKNSDKIKRYDILYKMIIEVLEARLESGCINNEKTGQTKIVLSYLYFHLWLQQGNERILIESRHSESEIVYNVTSANFIAIKYAREAFEIFSDRIYRNTANYIYSFNIYVYFIIDAAPDKEFREIHALRSEFMNLKGHTKNWHFRYNDTIARNFHRLSRLVSLPEAKLGYINSAIMALEPEFKKYKDVRSRDVNEVRAYINVLHNVKGELELAILEKNTTSLRADSE